MSALLDRLQDSGLTPLVLFRRVSGVCLVLLALLVWFGLAPEPAPAADHTAEIEQALSDYEANELLADSAPQQQVTNGWVAKDLLAIIAEQQNAAAAAHSHPDHRVPAMLGILVLGLALGLATSSGAVPS